MQPSSPEAAINGVCAAGLRRALAALADSVGHVEWDPAACKAAAKLLMERIKRKPERIYRTTASGRTVVDVHALIKKEAVRKTVEAVRTRDAKAISRGSSDDRAVVS